MEAKTNDLNVAMSKYKEAVLPVVLTLISLSLLFFVGLNSFNSISVIKEDLSLSQSKLTVLEEKRKNLEAIAGMAGVLDDNLALAVNALPEKDEISALLSQVQQISGEASVNLNSLQYTGNSRSSSNQGADAKKTGLENGLFVQTTVMGTYQQIIRFLELLENARRVVSVESLRLSTSSKEDVSSLNASLSITGYYLERSPQSISSATSPVRADFRSVSLNQVLEKLRSYKRYENIAPKPIEEPAPVEESVEEEQPVESTEI